MKGINNMAFIEQVPEIKDNTDLPYNPDFVAMIKQGEQDLKDKKGVIITLQELENLCK